ncbi:VanZ family protein [Desulfobulbus elongatus]|uniref:VanZ family protein n=1 Tax=Desulfobulbus elongatus TaxID=53332 RepID=UPI001B80824B|nr:VanZ family protein [Desulfobulbus elongatus]
MPWGIATAITASITLALCWWPFDFFPKNDVLADLGQGQAVFNMGGSAGRPSNNGHVFSRDLFRFDADHGAVFRLVITPLAIPRGLGCLLVLHDGGARPPLVIAQWQEHLALFVRAPEAKKGYREMGLRDRLPLGKRVVLTIDTATDGTRVFLDGELAARYKGFSLIAPSGVIDGRLILGNNQHGTEPWHGSIERVTVYDRSLQSAPVSAGPGTVPVFDCSFVHNERNTGTDSEENCPGLVIPERFRPLAPIMLAPLSYQDFSRSSTWRDIVFNIFGFLPISICLSCLAGRWTDQHWKRFGLTLLGASLLSLIIESGQYFLASRHSSQLDLLCNMVGALLAAAVAWFNAKDSKKSI